MLPASFFHACQAFRKKPSGDKTPAPARPSINRCWPHRLSVAAALGVALLFAGPARAVDLQPGDALVTISFWVGNGSGGADYMGALIAVDPTTGNWDWVSFHGDLKSPAGVALGPANEIYVVDAGSHLVLRVDPATGGQAVIAQLPTVHPSGIVVGTDNKLYVTASDYWGGMLLQIDPASGAISYFYGSGLFDSPQGVEAGPMGTIYVADSRAFGGRGGIIGWDPSTQAAWQVSSRGHFWGPSDLVVSSSGNLAVLDTTAFWQYYFDPMFGLLHTAGGIITVDAFGGQTVTSSYGQFESPRAIALDNNGDLLVADNGKLVRVNPWVPHNNQGDNQTVLQLPILVRPSGIVVVPQTEVEIILPPPFDLPSLP